MKAELYSLALSFWFVPAIGFAAFEQIDNFESYVTGSEVNNQGDWTFESSEIQVVLDPIDAGNKVLLVSTTR